jgi:CubicO group peptidase (beta-lactamase class C family)
MNHYNVPGVGVTYFDEAEIKWSKYFGLQEKGTDKIVKENSIFHACSISKMITALCVLKLAQDGKLDLYRDVNEYLTSWKIPNNEFTDKKKVALVHLLSHQGGFYDCDGSFGAYKQGDKIPKPADILAGKTNYHKGEVRVKYEPEKNWEYSDAGYCIIAQILEDVFGETIAQLAKRIIFDPLGLTKTFFWEIGKVDIDVANCVVGHNKKGEIVKEIRACYPNIEGAALWTTPNELACIAIDIIKSYNGIGGVILNQNMAKFMLTPFGCVDDVGMGVFLEKDKEGKSYFFSQGWGVGMQCKLRAYYEDIKGVVVMTNSEPGMEQDRALVGEIIEWVMKN